MSKMNNLTIITIMKPRWFKCIATCAILANQQAIAQLFFIIKFALDTLITVIFAGDKGFE